ncbi:MAG: prenyltransferase/squalene oxidase repeat-containing protein [Anaerolineae bacterium]
MDLEKAIAYVKARGNAVERARLAAILRDEPPLEAALQELAALQKPDGGFAYWVREVSNVCDTAFVLQWFDDLKVYRGPIVDPACRFLLDRQQEDGGWDEVEAVRALNPPEWMIPGRIETRVWLTAYCAHVLIRFGYAKAPGTCCPTDYLLAHSDETGRLAGYLRATWLALPMLAFYPGPDSEPFRRALAVAEAAYSPDWEGSYLAWLLRCLQDAGLPADHSLVTRCLADLKGKQRPDGSWEPEEGEGEEHAVNATVAALRALKSYGRI